MPDSITEAHDEGYREGFMWAKMHCDTTNAEWLKHKTDSELCDIGYLRLPTDASGIKIRIGDYIKRLSDDSKWIVHSILYKAEIMSDGSVIYWPIIGLRTNMYSSYEDIFINPEECDHTLPSYAEAIRNWITDVRNGNTNLKVLEQIADKIEEDNGKNQ